MDLTPLDKKRIRKVDGKKESFGATEHCYRQFEGELTLYADYLYHKLCLDADKNGMCFHSIRGLKSRLKCGHDAIYKAIDLLKKWVCLKHTVCVLMKGCLKRYRKGVRR